MAWKVGQRVRIKAAEAPFYSQPWRDRFEKRREGTVIADADLDRPMVEWDRARRARCPSDWIKRVHSNHLEPSQ